MPDNLVKIITYDPSKQTSQELSEGKSVYEIYPHESLVDQLCEPSRIFQKDGVVMIQEEDEDEETLENYIRCWMYMTTLDNNIGIHERIREIQHRNYLK